MYLVSEQLLQSPRPQCPDVAIRVHTIVHTHRLVSPIIPIIFFSEACVAQG